MTQGENQPAPAAGAFHKDDFSARITSPYLIGVYLAMNAVPDAYLFLDGPNCFPLKSPSVQGNHDWRANLSNVSGFHRVVTTEVHPSTVVFSREKLFLEMLHEMAAYEGTGGIFMSARPMAAITSLDYDRVCAKARDMIDLPIMHLPAKSLSSNWLGGYAQAQLAYARQVDLSDAAPAPGKVAVVGYLWDRNEGDHEGNLAELKRMLAALDLDLEVVWFSGQTFEELRRVRNVGAIISLPYGREAAQVLAERLDVQIVEADLPFGFGGSERFLETLGAAFGKEKEAAAFTAAELATYVPRLEWVIPFSLQNSRIGFIGDPHHFAGVWDILEMVGANLGFAGFTCEKHQLPGVPPGYPPEQLYFEPTQKFLTDFVPQQIREEGLDLLITSNVGTKLGNVPTMEFGYPSYFTHALAPRPFLGFVGTAVFVENMVNTIRHRQFY